jgi:hypothetical protein
MDFEAMEHEFCPQTIRQHSLQFDTEIFKRSIANFIRFALTEFRDRTRLEDFARR